MDRCNPACTKTAAHHQWMESQGSVFLVAQFSTRIAGHFPSRYPWRPHVAQFRSPLMVSPPFIRVGIRLLMRRLPKKLYKYKRVGGSHGSHDGHSGSKCSPVLRLRRLRQTPRRRLGGSPRDAPLGTPGCLCLNLWGRRKPFTRPVSGMCDAPPGTTDPATRKFLLPCKWELQDLRCSVTTTRAFGDPVPTS